MRSHSARDHQVVYSDDASIVGAAVETSVVDVNIRCSRRLNR